MNINQMRARAYASRIRSRAVGDGPTSLYGRLKSEHVEAIAQRIADANVQYELDTDGMHAALLKQATSQPAFFRTMAETAESMRQARHDAANIKVVTTDITRRTLDQLTADERLFFANTGDLPSRIVVQ